MSSHARAYGTGDARGSDGCTLEHQPVNVQLSLTSGVPMTF